MTIPTSTTTGKAARDNALKDAPSDAERSGSGEGGLDGKLIANTPFNPVRQVILYCSAWSSGCRSMVELSGELWGVSAGKGAAMRSVDCRAHCVAVFGLIKSNWTEAPWDEQTVR
ncbi:MAG: hypothetical protein ABSH01_02955 [Terriglobia bacterium]|jgi:hypothetical protein